MSQTFSKLGNALSRALTRERVCESCGTEFSCGASLRGCWCSEVELTDTTRAELQGQYRDCLCSVCLEKVAGNEAREP